MIGHQSLFSNMGRAMAIEDSLDFDSNQLYDPKGSSPKKLFTS